MKKKKLVSEIKRLCEKQYRKGFYDGFIASKEGKISDYEVSEFRHVGKWEEHHKSVDPITGKKRSTLLSEISEKMTDMQELINLFYEADRKVHSN